MSQLGHYLRPFERFAIRADAKRGSLSDVVEQTPAHDRVAAARVAHTGSRSVRCRGCGLAIPSGSEAITFLFWPLANRGSVMPRRAWLHLAPCVSYEEVA